MGWFARGWCASPVRGGDARGSSQKSIFPSPVLSVFPTFCVQRHHKRGYRSKCRRRRRRRCHDALSTSPRENPQQRIYRFATDRFPSLRLISENFGGRSGDIVRPFPRRERCSISRKMVYLEDNNNEFYNFVQTEDAITEKPCNTANFTAPWLVA